MQASAGHDLRSRDMIARLVGFDTTSRNSNLALIADIEAWLDSHGVASHRVYDETGQKANLYATIGPEGQGGVMLSGHVDVVPVDGQDWSTDPFNLVERDGRLYGRGACDMKTFVAIMLAYVPEMKRRALRKPIHLAISYDEEVGCIGVRGLIEHLNTLSVKPELCIVGEPTEMQPVIGHKGKVSMRVHVHGLECHSSLAPQGVNAVEYAAELITFIRGIGNRLIREGHRDDLYDLPHTTAHVGVVHGGSQVNIVPHSCHFDFEFRFLPEDDADALMAEVKNHAETVLEPQMKAVDPDAGFTWEPISAIDGLQTTPDEAVVTLVKRLAERNDHGKVAFGTEGGLFRTRGGIPTVVCGPGSIAQAHKPDEFITLDQVARGEAFMQRLLDRLSD